MPKNNFQTENNFDSLGDATPRGQECRPPIHAPELARLSDEELCRQARYGCQESRDLLWRRYHDLIRRILYRKNRHQHLPRLELGDALQESYFAFHLSVQRYDPEHHGQGKTASFKTFLGLSVGHKFSNYCTQWRRYRHRLISRFSDEAVAPGGFTAETPRPCSPEPLEKNEPAPAAQAEVFDSDLFSEGLIEVLCGLKSKEKHLLAVWLKYGRDKEVAQVLGISPAAAKLRRERLFRRIRKNVAVK